MQNFSIAISPIFTFLVLVAIILSMILFTLGLYEFALFIAIGTSAVLISIPWIIAIMTAALMKQQKNIEGGK